MSRIATPATVEEPPQPPPSRSSRPCNAARQRPESVSAVGTSPASLEGYLGLSGALGKGQLPAPTRERIALAVAQINGCDYCLSAHTYLGKNLAKLDDAEIRANRNGASNDPKADAAVKFAAVVTRERGHVSEDALNNVRRAGYSDPDDSSRSYSTSRSTP